VKIVNGLIFCILESTAQRPESSLLLKSFLAVRCTYWNEISPTAQFIKWLTLNP